MPILHDYTALERDMCFLLAEHGDPSGHDLGDALAELYSSGASQSSVYPVLKTLRRDGVVKKRGALSPEVVEAVGDDDGSGVHEQNMQRPSILH